MIQHQEERILPYKPEQLYALVADIERYPEFLPWCKALRVMERGQDRLTAQMVIGYKMFREKFSCRVFFNEPKAIKVEYLSGPLKSLGNEWGFYPGPAGQCRVVFKINFEFKGAILQKLAETFFHEVFKRMVASFEARAKVVYGKNTSP